MCARWERGMRAELRLYRSRGAAAPAFRRAKPHSTEQEQAPRTKGFEREPARGSRAQTGLQLMGHSHCCNREHKSGAAGSLPVALCRSQGRCCSGWSWLRAAPSRPRREEKSRKEETAASEKLFKGFSNPHCETLPGRGDGSCSWAAQLPTPCEHVVLCNAKSICLKRSDMTTHAHEVVPRGKIPFPKQQLGLNVSALHGGADCGLTDESGFSTIYLPSKHTTSRSIRIN